MPSEFDFVNLHLVGADHLRQRWRGVVWMGIILVLLGIGALVAAKFLTLATMVFLGALLIFVGLLQVIQAYVYRKWGGFFVDLLAGILYLVIGFLIVANPRATAEALTLLIAMFLIFGGLFRIAVAVMIRFHNAAWLVLHGTINVILGLMIWQQWPLAGDWLIGLFIGLDLIFNGWSLIMLGLAAKKLGPG
jgi:uncharacterized membrane protein HdeD (DUF308 family)